jgi:hypothetical protein
MSTFYITELNSLVKKRSKSEESKTNRTEENRILNNKSEIEEENSIRKGNRTKSKIMRNTKNEFLEFLIQEETNFADLEKIQEFYNNNTLKNFHQYNINQSLINKKKEELKNLEETIQTQIVTHLKIKGENLLSFYEDQTKELNEKIIIREHDLECYEHMHKRLYKSNVRKFV